MGPETFATDEIASVDTSEKAIPGVPQGADSDASESESKGSEGQARDSQESSESGRAVEKNDRPQRNSWKRTVDQLRASRREERQRWESEIGELKSQIQQLTNSSGRQSQKQSKTFWEAPEEVMDERMQRHLESLENRLMEKFSQRDTESQQSSEWKAETSEATKFIQSQKGLTDEDAEDIAELIRSTPAMQSMRPMERAEYAMFMWQKMRGITDKSPMKAKAGTVIGAGPATGGPKIWSEAEFNAELDKFPSNPKDYTKEQSERFNQLEREYRRAQKQGRVK